MKSINTAIEKIKRPQWLRKHRRMMRNGWTILEASGYMVAYKKAAGVDFAVRYFWTSKLARQLKNAKTMERLSDIAYSASANLL